MTGTNGKNQTPKKIILIDNLTEINEIVDFLDNETLVISFDYESHNKLLEQNKRDQQTSSSTMPNSSSNNSTQQSQNQDPRMRRVR